MCILWFLIDEVLDLEILTVEIKQWLFGGQGADSETEDDVGRGFRDLCHQFQNVLYLEKDLGHTGVCISQNLLGDLYNSLYILQQQKKIVL